MQMKSYITVLALAATSLAAPVPEPTTCSTGSTVASRGYGIICVGDSASKREPVPAPEPESVEVGSSGSGQALTKRTGMGIISSGNDDA
ncbi:hypothetical protein AB5N19_11902 [Seiridium cardinale]